MHGVSWQIRIMRCDPIVDPFAVVWPDVADTMNRWYGANEWFEKKGKEHILENPLLTRQQVLDAIPKPAQGARLLDVLPR